MILGIGSDITEVARIRASRERFGDRFLQRVFTKGEIDYCLSKANADERLAGRFAAKEAASKALGTGMSGGVSWRDFEVIRNPSGKPGLRFHGKASEYAGLQQVQSVHVTITHTADVAYAVVIFER